jgi:hypothetical protein
MDGSDENSVQDMGKFVAQCALLQDLPSKPHVAVVHHENANGTKPRGSTSLIGAGDVFIRVQKTEKGARSWTVVWGKDVEEGAKYGFALETVTLGFDEDMDVIESCVVVEAPVPEADPAEPRGRKKKEAKEEPAPTQPRRAVGPNQQLVLESLRDALFVAPDARPEGLDAPPGVAVVSKEKWWRFAREQLPHENEKKARDAFREAWVALVERCFVGHWQREFFWER